MLNAYSFKFSWFFESADAYSPFILIQLIGSMLILACDLFQIDLVGNFIVKIIIITQGF